MSLDDHEGWQLEADEWFDPLNVSINVTPKPSFGGAMHYGFAGITVEHRNGERLDTLSVQAAQKQALGGRWLPATFVLADNSEVDVLVGPRRQAPKPDPSAP